MPLCEPERNRERELSSDKPCSCPSIDYTMGLGDTGRAERLL